MTRKTERKIKTHLLKRLLISNRCKICAEVISIEKDYCDKCSVEKIRVAEGQIASMIFTKSHFDNLTSPFYYDNPLNKCIHNLKYNNFKPAGEFLSKEMSDVIERDFKNENPDFVTCIPMSRRRKMTRIFNHGEVMAKRIAKDFDVNFAPDLLKKIKNTKPQVSLTAKERETNLKGAFTINNKYDIKNKTILICDDVITTGSTLRECAKILKKAGAERVICAVSALNHKDYL